MKPRALILHATGSNRDHDAAAALQLADAQPEIVPLNQLRAGKMRWNDYQLLAIPGGFAYADALGAGRLLALDLRVYFADQVQAFVESGKPVIGICNGFQALVKAGLLPEPDIAATLTFNSSGHFECRWVTLSGQSEKCVWIRRRDETIYCPVAHGEGKFTLADPASAAELRARGQIALTYVCPDGARAGGEYPYNPNGSTEDIAGVCNLRGNVLGLMPHPENHIQHFHHPRWTRGERGQLGLQLFINGVEYAKQL